MAAAAPTTKRTVLLMGRTGNGKSTIANVLVGASPQSPRFVESDMAQSQTGQHQVETAVVDGMELTVVDTMGIGDTSKTKEEVCMALARAIVACKDGFHQLIFVVRGRMTKEEIEAFTLATILLTPEVAAYTTIVRSAFPAFNIASKCEEDTRQLKDISGSSRLPGAAEICNSVPKIMHVDNPNHDNGGEWEERRTTSRAFLLSRILTCDNLYKPAELKVIVDRVKEVVAEDNKLEKIQVDNENLMKQLAVMQQANANNQAMFEQLSAQLKDLRANNERIQKERDEQARIAAAAVQQAEAARRSGGGSGGGRGCALL